MCPRCTNDFHRDHLAAWLLSNSSCPVCREQLSDTFREDLKPKDAVDRKRLEDISRSFDNLTNTLGRWENSPRRRRKLQKMRTTEYTEMETVAKLNKSVLVIPFLLFVMVILIIIAVSL